MKEQLNPFVIFSVEKSDKSPEINALRTEHVEKSLVNSHTPYKKLLGVYKGTQEISFLVHADHFAVAADLARTYDQESILECDSERNVRIASLNGRIDKCGVWQEIPVHEAKELDSYTIDPTTGLCYVAR